MALIHAGAATAAEADTLLSKQMDVNTQTFIAKMKDKPMLLAATADLAKEDKPGT